MKIVLCVSGGLGNIILDYLVNKDKVPVYVLTDKKSESVIKTCSLHNIPFFAGNPRPKDWDVEKSSIPCDLLLSVNYLYIVTEPLLNWAKLYSVNIHGSLLPKYKGRTPHVWAIINGEKETGATAHLMAKEVDTGGILLQKKITIDDTDTGADILRKFEIIYPAIVDEVLKMVEEDNLTIEYQDGDKATYFGKRTPEDGAINWNWHRENIRNWIRAQAAPYPGAFFYYNNERIIVNKALFDEKGFEYTDKNGKILETGEDYIIVKTPNGALRLKELVAKDHTIFETGSILS